MKVEQPAATVSSGIREKARGRSWPLAVLAGVDRVNGFPGAGSEKNCRGRAGCLYHWDRTPASAPTHVCASLSLLFAA